jgi:peptide/nickel transport system substrate-binding protein
MQKKHVIAITAVILLIVIPTIVFAGGTKPKEEKSVFSVGLTVSQAVETMKPDGAWDYTAMGTTLFPLIYDQLWILGPAPDYKVIPRLATSWETEDGYTWTFHLRKDGKFHDGKPVTAEDVAFTIEYLPQADENWAYSDIVSVPDSIKVIDKYTVQFTLEVGMNGMYPPMGFKPILPKHIWEQYTDDLMAYDNIPAIGSGPFKFKDFKAEQYLWMEANDDYYAGRPAVDEVIFRMYGSNDAMYMALRKGEIQMTIRSLPAMVSEDLAKDPNIDIIQTRGEDSWTLGFNLHNDLAFQDVRVRRAILHGIDRQRILDMVYGGYGEIVDTTVTYPEMPEYNKNLPQYPYDPAKARKILEEAGYVDTDGDGIRNDPKRGGNLVFELLIPSDWTEELKAGTIISELMPDIGLQIDIKTVDENTFYSFTEEGIAEDKYQLAFINQGPSPYGDWIWENFRSAGLEEEGGWNQAYYINPKIDELIDKVLVEGNLDKKYALHREIQEILATDIPYAPLWRPDVLCPVRVDKWEGYTPAMGGICSWINPWSIINARPK